MQPCTIRQTVRLGRRSTGGPQNTMLLGALLLLLRTDHGRLRLFSMYIFVCSYSIGIIGNLIDFLGVQIFKVPTLRAEISPET